MIVYGFAFNEELTLTPIGLQRDIVTEQTKTKTESTVQLIGLVKTFLFSLTLKALINAFRSSQFHSNSITDLQASLKPQKIQFDD